MKKSENSVEGEESPRLPAALPSGQRALADAPTTLVRVEVEFLHRPEMQ
jgi:hypothetical protein